jgi:tetratricopeptide (TPR) repeat protein
MVTPGSDSLHYHFLELGTHAYPAAHADLAADLFEVGDTEGALIHASRAVELDPVDLINLNMLANVLLLRGDYMRAAEILERLIGIDSVPEAILSAALDNLAARRAGEPLS